jgi:hypothetical protein
METSRQARLAELSVAEFWAKALHAEAPIRHHVSQESRGSLSRLGSCMIYTQDDWVRSEVTSASIWLDAPSPWIRFAQCGPEPTNRGLSMQADPSLGFSVIYSFRQLT